MLDRMEAIEVCPSFVHCSAPMCPLDPMVEGCEWYPEDDICRKNFPPQWVKTQKKIKARTRNFDTYYTLQMLQRNCVVGRGMVGIDPNKARAETEQLESWLRRHPEKKPLTEGQKEVLRERFKENRRNIK